MVQSSRSYMKEQERMPVDVFPLMRADMEPQLVVTYSAADPDAALRGCREIETCRPKSGRGPVGGQRG